jgi:hypothetical protein
MGAFLSGIDLIYLDPVLGILPREGGGGANAVILLLCWCVWWRNQLPVVGLEERNQGWGQGTRVLPNNDHDDVVGIGMM